MEWVEIRLLYKNKLNELHAVSRAQQGMQNEFSVRTLHLLPNSGGIVCWVVELNAAVRLDTRAEKLKLIFK